ncbi:oligosaccharide flippase family protein [Priestia flexa]|uniref:oligosaccharide flippase family protein n=1 Tax=Priestia flexa TaxID=86664 RepID=UPI003FD04AC9
MSDKKKLIENFSALALMQILNYILPFLILPYLVRVLNPTGYGVYIFSQAFIQYFIIIVDYGFDLSATREIAIHRNNKDKVNTIVSSVLFIKSLLSIVCFFMLLVSLIFIPILREYWYIHLLTYGMVIGNAWLSIFVYQGLERMKFITIFNASIKIIFTLAVFIFVNEPNDLFLVPLINSLGYLVVGIVSIISIIKLFEIKIYIPSFKDTIYYFRSSTQFFWSRVAVSLYTTSNTFIIGIILGPTAAGIFGSADKLFRGFVSLYNPLNNVLYPYVAYSKNINLYKKIFQKAFMVNLGLCIVGIVGAEIIIYTVFGKEFEQSVNLLRFMLIAAIFMMPSIIMGYPLLGALGKINTVNKSVIYPSLLHITLLVCSMPVLSLELVTVYIIITELFVFIYRIIAVKKYQLLK